MENNTPPQATALTELFIKTFGTPTKALEFFIEMLHRVCYYHKDPELARDSAFTIQVFSKEMVFDILDSKSTAEMMERLTEGAGQVLCFLNTEVIMGAGRYMTKAMYAYGKEMESELENIESDIEKLDFFFEVGNLARRFEDSGAVVVPKFKPING